MMSFYSLVISLDNSNKKFVSGPDVYLNKEFKTGLL